MLWRRTALPYAAIAGIAGLVAGKGRVAPAIEMLTVANGGTGGPLLPLALFIAGFGQGMAASPTLTVALSKVAPQDAPDASGVLTTIIQLGLVIGVATFGSIFQTEAVVPGAHPTASAMALTLWLIVADLAACAVASLVMVRAQPARAVVGVDTETREVDIVGDAT